MKLPLASFALCVILVFAICLKAGSEKTPIPVTGKIVCPQSIAPRQKVIHPVPGWDVYFAPPSHSSNIEFYTGNPGEGALMITGDEGLEVTAPVSDVWVECDYRDTRFVLFRPVGLIRKGCKHLPDAKDESGDSIAGVFCE